MASQCHRRASERWPEVGKASFSFSCGRAKDDQFALLPLSTVLERPRWTFHFTPTSLLLGQRRVETFFATLTRRRLHRGAFRSLVDLQAAINRYLEEHNQHPNPFIWTADPDRIIEKVSRGYQALASDR